jgi:hypothetical protein
MSSAAARVEEISETFEDAYRSATPKSLIEKLDTMKASSSSEPHLTAVALPCETSESAKEPDSK